MKLRFLSALLLASLTTIYSCKKEAEPQPEPDNTAELKAHADDQKSAAGEMDAVASEASAVLEGQPGFTGRTASGQNTFNVCGATAVADTASNPRTITITYNGNNCAGTHLRIGVVVLSMPAGMRWRDAGSVITITYQNLKAKRLNDNKSITLNGTQQLTNVSGGLLLSVLGGQTIMHTITSSNMSLNFDDNTQRNWQVARKRVFSNNGGLVLTITGIGATGSVTNAAEWGTNRFGNSFITSITQPLVFRTDCGGRLTAGQVKHEGFATATVTFGLNASGAASGCPANGSYYYQLVWAGPNGASFNALTPY